jgi:glutamine synthetase
MVGLQGRDLGFSPLGYQFLAGLLHHAPALTALCAPTVNSYKRLMCGQSLSGTSWAPAFIGYGDNNRTVVARTVHQRIEWRLPDSSANPYLALAGVIAAGLDGIDRQLDPGDPVNHDVYEMNDAQRAGLGLQAAAAKPGRGSCGAKGGQRVDRGAWREYCQ